ILEGAQVTREGLFDAMRAATVLHVAAHGAHRVDAPHLSYIQLEDGRLTAGDLFQRTLSASLITLSACDSGQAVIQVGDDPVGLARGFLAAGARSVLVSLWQLEDNCALALMRRFYEKLADGAPKAGALRSAQLSWLQEADGRFRHPFYWGGLQLVGDVGPL
ncbi:MAG: CHAT domain-containing protein, partial [Ardenticatenaceae bacterium]